MGSRNMPQPDQLAEVKTEPRQTMLIEQKICQKITPVYTFNLQSSAAVSRRWGTNLPATTGLRSRDLDRGKTKVESVCLKLLPRSEPSKQASKRNKKNTTPPFFPCRASVLAWASTPWPRQVAARSSSGSKSSIRSLAPHPDFQPSGGHGF